MVKLTAAEATAVSEAWGKVMATNVGDTSSGLLLAYKHCFKIYHQFTFAGKYIYILKYELNV